jgi:hypothetical protein
LRADERRRKRKASKGKTHAGDRDAYFYGVSFLADSGYFDKQRRFWTDKDFPDASATRAKIRSRLKAIGLSDPGMKDAYELLHPAN